MGFRFRRTFGLVPGVRLNLGMRSGSVSFGMRGLHYTVGTRGSRITAGIPGTGLFWTKKLNSTAGISLQPGTQQPSPPLAGGSAQPTTTPPFQTILQSPGGGTQLPTSGHAHIFVPLWFVYASLTVVVIAGFCVVAAMAGGAGIL
jgi:hypothetical protein